MASTMASNQPRVELELHVEETSPHNIHMVVTAATILTTTCAPVPVPAGETLDGSYRPQTAAAQPKQTRQQQRGFQVIYYKAKSLLGSFSGNENPHMTLHYTPDNLQGVLALVDGGYNAEDQICPERRLELTTKEKYPMVLGEWILPKEKHERALRLDMITGALKALLLAE